MKSLNDIVKCAKCEERAIIAGLCASCASKELTQLRQDVAAQIEARKDADREVTRLRRIEAAVMDVMDGFNHELPEVILWWRVVAKAAPAPVARVCDAIADALETK